VAESSIPVDLLNPGQVFACIGFAEAADVLLGDAEGAFVWSDPTVVRFWLRARGEVPPVPCVLAFLENAEAIAVAPARSASVKRWKKDWGSTPTLCEPGGGYPFPDPSSPATLVCLLKNGKHSLAIDHWGDQTVRDNVKFWAGAGGYPGAALARDALRLLSGRVQSVADDPFALSGPQSSSFRLDWRRDYIPIDLGFSLNKHDRIVSTGYPIVELLAAIGLSNARPLRPERRNKLEYRYGVIGRARDSDVRWFPLSILRAALGAPILPFPTRSFRMLLGWSGQEGQARSITVVTEETTE